MAEDTENIKLETNDTPQIVTTKPSPSKQSPVKQSPGVSDGGSKGVNRNLAIAITAAAFGSAFQHGYNTGVVNAPQTKIETFIYRSYYDRYDIYPADEKVTLIWSVCVSIFCVGGVIGGLVCGFLADYFGRKKALLLNNIFVLLAAILEGTSKKAGYYEMIMAGRFFIGLNSGINAGLAPMYLTEISPVSLRGSVGSVYQLVITISILLSQILGLEGCLGTHEQWPLLLALTIVPGIIQVATLPFCPESPKYTLIIKQNEEECIKGLKWLRQSDQIEHEMAEYRAEHEAVSQVPKVTLKQMFNNRMLRTPLIIAMVTMIAQQLSGINAVIFFSTHIFREAGLTTSDATYATMGMGIMNVAMTIISLILVEKAGRKTLQLIGLGGMCIDTLILAICLTAGAGNQGVAYFSILLVIMFVVFFATGPGSIPWFLVTELFSQGARPMATSLAVTINWVANFIVSLSFLPLQLALEGYVFLIFVVLLAIFFVFTWFFVPETKNKTIEEITAIFRRQNYQENTEDKS